MMIRNLVIGLAAFGGKIGLAAFGGTAALLLGQLATLGALG